MNRLTRHADDLRPDVVFDVLSHPYRRFVISYVAQQCRPIPMNELADRIVASELDVPLAQVPEEDRYCARLSMYHTHLPKLVDAGLVDCTEEADRIVVRLTSTFGTIEADLPEPIEPYHVD